MEILNQTIENRIYQAKQTHQSNVEFVLDETANTLVMKDIHDDDIAFLHIELNELLAIILKLIDNRFTLQLTPDDSKMVIKILLPTV